MFQNLIYKSDDLDFFFSIKHLRTSLRKKYTYQCSPQRAVKFPGIAVLPKTWTRNQSHFNFFKVLRNNVIIEY